MQIISYLVYLIASVLFIIGIKKLGSPKTARQGNMLSSLGMLLAVVITLLDQSILTFEYIIIGLVVGSAIGGFMALKVQMTGMPQMVAMLNGFGGGASACRENGGGGAMGESGVYVGDRGVEVRPLLSYYGPFSRGVSDRAAGTGAVGAVA